MGLIKKVLAKLELEDMKYVAALGKRYKARLALLILVQFPLAGATVGYAFLIKHLIDAITGKNGEQIGYLVLLSALIVLTQALVQLFTARLSVKTSAHIVSQMQQELFCHLQRMEYRHLNQRHSGEWMTLMTSDITNVSGAITDVFPKFISSISVGVGALIGAVMLFPIFSLALILIVPISLLYHRFYGSKLKGLQIEAQEKDSRVRSFVQDALGIMNVIKTFGDYELWRQKLDALQAERTKVITRRTMLSGTVKSIASVSSNMIFILVLFAGSGMVKSGVIEFGTLFAFVQMILMVTNSFRGAFSSTGGFINCFGSAHRLLKAMELECESEAVASTLQKPVGIRFDGVWFSYDQKTDVLKDASFEIPAGSLVGMIGESGIGKSTIANLIVGLYAPANGHVVFMGGDKTEEAGSSTRSLVAYVPQGSALIAGSIRENILMGNNQATDEEILQAIRAAHLDEFVESLPQGLDTVVGEKAAMVSAGQAQRISIARALLRNAPVLLLDEPTSALDPQTEMSILNNLKSELPGITKIIITHRHDALDFCDMTLLVTDEGQVEVKYSKS